MDTCKIGEGEIERHNSKFVQTWEQIHPPIGAYFGAIGNVFKVSLFNGTFQNRAKLWIQML